MEWNFPPPTNETCFTSADPDIVSCHGRARCVAFGGERGDLCDCPVFYDPRDHCKTNFFEIFNGVDLFHPVIGLIVITPFLFLYALEIVADLLAGKRTFRSPSFWAKIAMLLFCIVRTMIFGNWIYRTMYKVVSVPALDGFLIGLGIVVLATTLPLVVISWIDILLMAKSLGQKLKRVKVFRVIMYCILGIGCPLLFVGAFFLAFGILSDVANVVMGVILFVGSAAIAVIIIILLRSVLPWISSQLKEAKDASQGNMSEKLFETIRRKSKVILAIVVILFLLVIQNVVVVVFGIQLPLRLLVLMTMLRYFEISIAIVMFWFLESHFFRSTPFLAYFYIMAGRDIKSLSFTAATSKSKNKSTGKESSKGSTASTEPLPDATAKESSTTVNAQSTSESSHHDELESGGATGDVESGSKSQSQLSSRSGSQDDNESKSSSDSS